MTNEKSQARIHRFTIGIIITITLVVIGGNIANIDAVEFNEAFGTSFGETEDNGFEPEPLDAELSQPTKDIYTSVKKEIVQEAIPETATPVEKTPETTAPVEKTPEPHVEKTPEPVAAKDPVVEPTKKKEPKPEPKPEPVKPSFEPTNHSGDYMSEIELNMRSGPSVDFPSVGTLKPYTKAVANNKATVSGGSSEWYEITVNGVTGWSSSNYLKPYKVDAKPKPKPKPEPTASVKTDGFSFKGHHFSLGSFSGTGKVPQETNKVYQWADLPTHYLVERASPAGRVIRQVGVGDEVVVDGQRYTVTHIESGIPNDLQAYGEIFKHDADMTFQTCDNTKGPNGRSDVTYWWTSKK